MGSLGKDGSPGLPGATGNGISTINKTSTSGLVDTYTITYTNGDTDTFTVTNGKDGSNYETWGLTYYKDNVQNATQAAEYVLNEVNNVSLNENDVVDIYGRSNSNGTWEYNYALVIEEE